ncbi:ABC transporter permease subunit [Streptococcus orisasini]|uniref:ABC transporter permease subunit n=1 Tax=Streptococcus orisasini TaxID=1080071 RepID=UPI00070965D8|nr:ABC transporter permease subunit [Streptococcus orisasini]
MILLKHELKLAVRNLLIWSLSVGLICWGCILLYKSVEDQLASKTEIFSNMGSMTQALGMDKISIATFNGYFATQIALMFGLGAGMFASMLGVTILSKEEEGHTSEFLYTLPYSRWSILIWKFLSLIVMLLAFNLICVGFESLGIWQIHLDFSNHLFLKYHLLALLMQLEIASICFFISSISRRRQMGAALGLTLLFYVIDMVCRIVPDLEKISYLTPYYFANGADIFSQEKLDPVYLVLALGLILISLAGSVIIFQKKDLAA